MADIRIIPSIGAINVTGSAEFRGAGGSTLLYMTGSGGIGVGTTVPLSEFHIKGTGTRFITLDRTSTRSWDLGINSSGTLLVTDNTTSADRIAITLSGSVGIGTTQPSEQLNVVGGAKFGNSSDYIRFSVENSNAKIELVDNNQSNPPTIYGNGPYMEFHNGGSQRIRLNSNGTVQFNAYGSGTNTGTAAYSLTVDSSGNIIESTLATINGSGTANYIPKWSDSDTLTNSILFESASAVGVGITTGLSSLSNSAKFEVYDTATRGNGGGSLRVTNTTSAQTVLALKNTTSGKTWEMAVGGTSNTEVPGGFYIYEAGVTSRLVITGSNGNVGIGTKSPTEKLHVAGRITATTSGYTVNPAGAVFGLYTSGIAPTSYIQAPANGNVEIWNDGTGAIATFTDSGKVGIGNNSPTQALTVQGNISASGDLFIGDDVFVGSAGNGAIQVGSIGYIDGTSTSIFNIYSPGDIYLNADSNNNGNSRVYLKESGDTKLTAGYDGVRIYDDLTVDGIITAKEFHTTFVSASIVYASGSTKFGDSQDDNHAFTGSIHTSGSVRATVNGNGNYIEFAADDIYPSIKTNGSVIRVLDRIELWGRSGARYLDVRNDAGTQNIYLSGTGNSFLASLHGNVGIGLITPTAKLHVSSSSTEIARLDSANTSGGYLTFANSDTVKGFAGFGGTLFTGLDSNNFGIRSQAGLALASGGGFTRVYITSGGSVGIGTTSPATLLHAVTSVANGQYRLETTHPSGIPNLELKGDSSATIRYISGSSNVIHSRIDLRQNGLYLLGDGATNQLIVKDTGVVQITDYGSGTNTGTQAYNLAVDSSGNIIETGIAVDGSGTANYIPKWSDSDTLTNSVIYQDANGNIGIGTTVPDSKLNVYTATGRNFRVDQSTANVSILRNDYHLRLWAGNGYDLQFETGTSSTRRMTIAGGGNVGINTTAPSAKLNVVGGADVLIVEGSGSTSNTTIMAVDGNNGRLFEVSDDLSDSLFSVNTIAGLPVMEAFADNVVTLGAYNQYDLHITGSRVGIGTSAPEGKLHILGNYDANNPKQLIIASREDAGSVYSGIQFERAGGGTFFGLGNDSRTDRDEILLGGGFGSVINATAFRVFTGARSSTIGTERLTVISDGNVGIGSASPGYKLDVNGTARIQDSLYLGAADVASGHINAYELMTFNIDTDNDDADTRYFGWFKNGAAGSGTSLMRLLETGNLGIGTDSPSNILNIYEDSTSVLPQVRIENDGTGDAAITLVATGITGWSLGLDNSDSDKFKIGKGAAAVSTDTKFTINSDGNLGVGTTAPARHLHVNDDSSYAGVQVQASASQDSFIEFISTNTIKMGIDASQDVFKVANTNFSGTGFVLNTAGNLGIGTTNPFKPLHVQSANDAPIRVESTDPTTGILFVDSNSSNALYYVGSGDYFYTTATLGIGTSSPTGKFNSYISATRQITHNGNGGDLSVISDNNTTPVFYVKGTGTADLVNVFDDTAEVFTILDGGSVGIGTSSPAHKLEVYENGADAIVRIHEDAGTHNARLHLRSGGNDTWLQNLPGSFEIRTEGTLSSGPAPLGISAAGNVSLGYDLDVTGIITAKEFHTTFVSASIIYQSGSTKFGNSTDDNHDFTGSINLQAQSGASGLTISRGGDLYMSMNSDSSRQIFTYGTNLDFRNINGTSRMYLSGSGNVGIGTNTPSARLHVSDTSNASNAIFNTRTNGGYITLQEAGTDRVYLQWGLTYNGQSGGNYLLLTNAENGGSVSLQTKSSGGTYNSAALVVNSDGNVGIGTTGPDSPLNVYRSTATPASSTGTTLLSLNNYVGSDLSQQKTFIDFNLTDDNANFTPQVRIGAEVGRNADANAISKEGAGAFIVYTADGTDEAGAGSLTEKMRVDYAGNVGIGTINPGTRLDVWNGDLRVSGSTNEQLVLDFAASAGSYTYQSFRLNGTNKYRIFGYTSGDFGIYSDVASSYPLYINSDGNVGINTTSPSDKLHVQEGDIRIDDPNNGTVRGLYIRHSGITGNVTSLVQDTSGTPRASLRSTERSLWIQAGSAGSSPASDVRLYANQVMGLMVSSSGNVGINTTTPADKLEVSGNVRITNNSPILYFYDTDVTDLRHRILGGGNAGLEYSADIGNVTTGYHRWDIANSEKMRLIEGGNLGLGTDTPTAGLHISRSMGAAWLVSFENQSASGHGLIIRAGGTTGTRYITQWYDAAGNERFHMDDTGEAYFQNDIATDGEIIFDANNSVGQSFVKSGGDLNLIIDSNNNTSTAALIVEKDTQTAGSGTELFRIQEDGNVGIGATAPSAKLEIDGTLYIDTADNSGSIQLGASADYPNLGKEAQLHLAGGTNYHWNLGGKRKIFISDYDNDGTSGVILFEAEDENNSTDIKFTGRYGSTPSIAYFAGEVGIGKTDPTWQLDVKGGIVSEDDATTSQLLMRQVDANVAEFQISPSSDSPSNYFQFRPNSQGADSGVRVYDRYETDYIYLRHDGGSGHLGTKASAGYEAGNLNFLTAGDLAMTIESGSSNIGIGTGTPSYKLDVFGSARIGGVTGDAELIIEADTDNSGENDNPRIILKQDGAIVQGTIGFNGDAGNAFTGALENAMYISTYDALQLRGGSGGIVTINGNGNVGIGTNSPNYALEVRKDVDTWVAAIHNTGSDANAQGLLVRSEATSAHDATVLGVYADSGYKMVVRSTGNVGINTTSPTAKLHVRGEGTTSSTFAAKFTDSSGGNIMYMRDDGAVVMSNGYLYVDHADGIYSSGKVFARAGVTDDGGNLGLGGHSSTSNLTLSGSVVASFAGSVGVGTASPYQKLHVNGNIYLGDNSTTGEFIHSGTSVALSADTNILIVADANDTSGATPGGEIIFGMGTATDTNGTPSFTWANAYPTNVPRNEWMRISNTGNVGIGITNPNAPLNINIGSGGTDGITGLKIGGTGNYPSIELGTYGAYGGMLRSYGNDLFYFAGHWRTIGNTASENHYHAWYTSKSGSTDWSTVKMKLDHEGNLGVGTSSTTAKLEVAGTNGNIKIGDASNYNGISLNGTLDIANYNLLSRSSDKSLYINRPTGNNIYFREQNSGNQMFIESGGNVGINTTTPSAKLNVVGSADVLIVEGSGSTANTTIMAVDGNNGRLFEVSDDLSDSLFSVNTIAGLPVMEAFADNTVVLGAYNQCDLVVTGSQVGIGTCSPQAKVHVSGSARIEGTIYSGDNGISTNNSLQLSYSAQSGVGTIAAKSTGGSTTLALQTSDSGTTADRLYIASNGNVGIGTASPSYKLHVDNDALNTNSPALYVRNPNSAASGVIAEFVGDSDSIQIRNISTGGDYAIYNTQQNNGIALYDGTGGVEIHYNGATVLEADSNGGIKVTGQLSATADVIAYSSDERLKENIKPIENAVDKVKQMRGVTFDWNKKSEELGFEPTTKLNDVGVIAQEVEKVFPQLIAHAPFDIDSDEEGNTISKSGEDYKTVNYSRLTAVLIEAIKEQQEQIEELKEEIKKLKG